MSRFLNSLLVSLCVLFLSVPAHAVDIPGDTLTENYMRALDSALYKRISENEHAYKKDYLIAYPPAKDYFLTDFQNNGQYFWYAEGTEQEKLIRQTVANAQLMVGKEPLYIILGSIYNYLKPAEITDPKWDDVKTQKKYTVEQRKEDRTLDYEVIPEIKKHINKDGVKLPEDVTVIYIISFFSVDATGNYKVSHRCVYHGKNSLIVNGFKIDVSDYVYNNTLQDKKKMRCSFLMSVVEKSAFAIQQFNKEYKEVSEFYSMLPANCLGRRFFNEYEPYCKDKLILMKTALLINEIGYDIYNAYMAEKKNKSDSYDLSVFRDFYQSLYKYNEHFKTLREKLDASFMAYDVVKVLFQFSKKQLAILPYEDRIKAIRTLSYIPELYDNSVWNLCSFDPKSTVPGAENMMVQLITSTPTEQQQDLLADLKGDGDFALLNTIFKKVDDARPAGQNNYSELVSGLATIVLHNASGDDLKEVYDNNRVYTFKDGILRNVQDEETRFVPYILPTDGWATNVNGLYVSYWYEPVHDRKKGTIYLQQYKSIREILKIPNKPFKVEDIESTDGEKHNSGNITLNPYQLIAMIPTEKIDYRTGFSLEKDDIVMVPAFFLEWYLHKKDGQNVKDAANYTLAAVTIATGTSGIIAGATVGAKILAAAEMVFSLTSIAGEYESFNKTMKDALGNKGYATFKGLEFGVNLFFAGKGTAALGKSGIETVNKMCNEFRELIKNTPGLMTRLRVSNPKMYAKISNLLDMKDVQNAGDMYGAANAESSLSRTLGSVVDEGTTFTPITKEGPVTGLVMESPPATYTNSDALFVPGSTSTGNTIVAAEKQTATIVAESRLKELFPGAPPLIVEKPLTYADMAAEVAKTPQGLQKAQKATQPARLKIIKSADGVDQMVVVAIDQETNIVLQAKGSIKPIVEVLVAERLLNQKPKPETPTQPQPKYCEMCVVEPIICELREKSSYEKKDLALTKLCLQLPALQRPLVCARLYQLEPARLDKFLQVVAEKKSSCNTITEYIADNVSSITTDIVDAWQIYERAGRNCLVYSFTHMKKLTPLMTNTKARSTPYSITDDNLVNIAYACGQQGTQAGSVDDDLFENLNEFINRQYPVNNFVPMMSNLENSNGVYTVVGANWVLKYMQKHPTEFNYYTDIVFEHTTVFDDMGNRISDLVTHRGDSTYLYEFKSYQTTSLPPSTFMDQFLKDVRNPALRKLEHLNWIFDGSKTDSASVMKSLRGKLVPEYWRFDYDEVRPKFDVLGQKTGYGPIPGILEIGNFFRDTQARWFTFMFYVTDKKGN